jgi:hypothetical protein
MPVLERQAMTFKSIRDRRPPARSAAAHRSCSEWSSFSLRCWSECRQPQIGLVTSTSRWPSRPSLGTWCSRPVDTARSIASGKHPKIGHGSLSSASHAANPSGEQPLSKPTPYRSSAPRILIGTCGTCSWSPRSWETRSSRMASAIRAGKSNTSTIRR